MNLLFMYAVLLWAGNCQPFSLFHVEHEEQPEIVEPQHECTEMIKGPYISDEILT